MERKATGLATTVRVGDLQRVPTRPWLMVRTWFPVWARTRLAALLAVLCVCATANGQEIVRLDATTDVVRLRSNLVAVYKDPGRASLAEVRALPDSEFVNGHDRNRCFGFQMQPFWARFVSEEESAGSDWLLEIPEKSLDSVTVFTRGPDGTYTRWDTGDMYPFGSREVRHRNFVFSLEHSGLGPDTTFVRAVTKGPMCLPMNAYSHVGFHQVERRRQFFIGGFFGIVVVMLLFNLIIWLMLRDAAYGVFVLYVSSFFLYQVSVERLGFEFLWPSAPGWEQLSYGVFALLTTFFTVHFARVFLKTYKLWHGDDVGRRTGSFEKSVLRYLRQLRKGSPLALRRWFAGRAHVDRALLVTMAVCVPLLVFHLGARRHIANQVLILFVFGVTLLLTYVAVLSMIKKHVASKHYFAAWMFFFGGTIVSMLGYLTVLPIGNLRLRVVQIGSAIQLTLLALALGFRLKLDREEAARQRNIRAVQRDSSVRRNTLLGALLHSRASPLLNRIKQFLTGLRNGERPSKEEVEGILSNADALHDLVRKVGEGWERGPSTLGGLRDEVLDMLAQRFDGTEVEKDIYEAWHPDPESHDVDLPSEVTLVALHMISEIGNNTLKHARATKLHLQVSIEELADGGRNRRWLFFEMWDNGVGMPEGIPETNGRGLRDIRLLARIYDEDGDATLTTGRDGRGVLWKGKLPFPKDWRPEKSND